MASERDKTDGAAQFTLGRAPVFSHTSAGQRRRVAGIFVSSGCRRLSVAMITTIGHGLDCQVEQSNHITQPLDDDVRGLYRDLIASREAHPAAHAQLATMLAERQAALIGQLLEDGQGRGEGPLAIGVYDPGLWSLSTRRRSYRGLCDAALLAELTGHCVIDGFPARDVACGGLGGPLLAVPLWMLLRDTKQPKVLLDLGRTVHATLIPAGNNSAARRVVALDVGPGTSLLDRLAAKMTDGKQFFDAGGHMAVQGRLIPELAEHWLEDPFFQQPTPRWHPLGCRHEHELGETVRMAIEAGWSIRDLLCTACHFIAATIAQAVAKQLTQSSPIREILLSGRGQQNGMLLRGIASRLPEVKLRSVSTIMAPVDGLDDAALEPMAVALLTLLHIDQVPANHTALTGTDASRVLGRLTPGLPQNWQRLLRMMADSQPQAMSLRRAV